MPKGAVKAHEVFERLMLAFPKDIRAPSGLRSASSTRLTPASSLQVPVTVTVPPFTEEISGLTIAIVGVSVST